MANTTSILWVDDEIDMLGPHQTFLKNKGYDIVTATNGYDAIDMLQEQNFDIIFLDENMPGISGLDTLLKIKEISPITPVVMVTKSEEEHIMEQAIGSKIADYLIKPVNPNQLLLCIKKHIESNRLIQKTTQHVFQSQFQQIIMQTMECSTFDDWCQLYQKLVYWELDLQNVNTMDDIHMTLKQEANSAFAKFIKKNYCNWITDPDNAPLMSNKIMSKRILPMLENGENVVLIVIDNCRLDQWETMQTLLSQDFKINTELYCSILPTATLYARNAIFSGLMPLLIKQLYPDYWVESEDESSQNKYENQLLGTFFERYRKRNISYGYYKVNDNDAGVRLLNIFHRYKQNNLNAFVYNFVDMLSHARTETKMIKELSMDEAAYRSLTESWFKHSPLYKLIMILKQQNVKIAITTDHGAIRVSNPLEIAGDKDINTNLRFKTAKNITYNPKQVFEIKNPEEILLPKSNLSSSYIFATNNDFFIYRNNHSYYSNMFKDTFQHGGISMEEMIVPLAILEAK
jgi:CheY-like chemotaxis protein